MLKILSGLQKMSSVSSFYKTLKILRDYVKYLTFVSFFLPNNCKLLNSYFII